MSEKSIDLTNVDYDDVLHLYRGWRKAEAALKEKTKELDDMKEKVQQLQDGHVKFRGQMNALESVKDLTISLQAQINVLQEENKQLLKENRDLSNRFAEADTVLREKVDVEKVYSKALKETQEELVDLRQRYLTTEAANKELESILSEEKGLRISAESRLEQADEAVEQLTSENSSLRVKLDSTIMRMNQCDQELAHASQQLSELTQEIAELNSEKEALMTAEAEIGVLKGDISRLLRLFEYYPAARGFLDRWYDSDGMAFLGMPTKDKSHHSAAASSSRRNSFSKGNISSSSNTPGKENSLGIDYRSLGIEGDEDEKDEGDIDLNATDLTPGDVAQLKRIYGGDPFPMTGSFEVSMRSICGAQFIDHTINPSCNAIGSTFIYSPYT
jgi:DNA repair exonuclease SbcCD ATPase subunit